MMLVLRGDSSYPRFWLKSRGWIPFVPLLLMVAGNEDGSPLRSGQVYGLTAATLVIGAYLLAVHVYIRRRILPVEYRFFQDRVEAWRGDEKVASVLIRDVVALAEGWYTYNTSFEALYSPDTPRAVFTLRDGTHVTFPKVCVRSDEEIPGRVAEVTGIRTD
ncbi:hypothetical protein [Aeromicrobium sp. CnD17-E]|uniref:hypothetical protein n=1 Tax=Aeromicrobium sp. CnD17-E TaxID=2954487 RepID=UPI00209748CC|nr:hypothetical protein [Aeromicrobium sp. CnD17-E]MCO7237737.1 hypothetical protein [Aeromicrobium sp. CnD17-E]